MRFGVAMIAIVFYPSIGGAQTHTLRLSQKLRARGVDAYVITRHHRGLARYEEVDGVPTYRVGKGDGNKAVAAASFMAGALRVLREQRRRTNVIHAHQLLSPSTIGMIARAASGKPLVMNPHRSGPLGDVGILTLRRPTSGKLRLAAARRLGDAFVCISPAIHEELAGAGIPAERLWDIANGVDVDHFAPAAPARKAELRRDLGFPEGPLAFYAGRLVKEKGLDVLLQAWAALRGRLPQARLLIMGEGDQEARLQALAGELGLRDVVRFMPGRADVAPCLQAADVFVLPSFAEGLPVALLEGMSTGLACVATATSGSAQLISDRANGRLPAVGDPAALAEALAEALAGPQAREWGERARQTVVQHYSLDSVADRYVQMYEALLPGLRSRQSVTSM